MLRKLIVINNKDNVAIALIKLPQSKALHLRINRKLVYVKLVDDIPAGHKFALRDICKGKPIYQYGHMIGLASKRITKGEHVHVHNVESVRGRGDRQ